KACSFIFLTICYPCFVIWVLLQSFFILST
ncbi:uncharacterized protein METZ01_LOCUS286558, partial [marine metagenome]